MESKKLKERMNEIGVMRNKVEKLKDFINQENSSKNLRFVSGSNRIELKDSDFENNYLNKVADSILKQLNKEIDKLNSSLKDN